MDDSLIRKLNWSATSTLICCFVLFIYLALYKKGKKIHFEDCIVFILMVVISSLRYGVGSDYFRYLDSAARWVRLFDTNIKSLFSIDVLEQYSFEVGYKLLAILSHRISESPYTIFWLVSLIIYVPLVLYCRKYTKDSRFAIAVYLLFGYWGISMNVIGQSIAMIFVLFAMRALEEKKYAVCVLLAIFAEMFHTTAIIAILLIVLSRRVVLKKFFEPKKRNLANLVIIGIILRFSTEIFRNLLSRFTFFASYSRYLSTGVSDLVSRRYMMIGAFLEGVLVLAILYIAIEKLESNKDYDKRLAGLISVVMIGIPFNIVGISRSDWLWLSNRFAEYFFIFLIALVPEMMVGTANDTRRGLITFNKRRLPFWIVLTVWHAIFAIVMFNNNRFVIDTYLFK